jgi:hypothetical protein
MSEQRQTLRHEKQLQRWERRKQMVRQWAEGRLLSEYEDAISKLFNISVIAIQRDWGRRKRWMPVLAHMEDAKFKMSDILLRVQRIGEACWETYRMAKKANNMNAMVGALDKLLSLAVRETELCQSLGILPKIAEKLHLESVQKKVDVSVDIKAVLERYETVIERASNRNLREDDTEEQVDTSKPQVATA